MRLTTRSSYGIRALISMAAAYGQEKPLSLKDISKEEEISCVYLEQIFNKLKRSGLVKSVRGPKGGYLLSKDPSELTVLEVVTALEDSYAGDRCLCGKELCEKASRCASKEVWEEVSVETKKALGRFSLGRLAARSKELAPQKS
jgi:Rrf2 family protein